MPSLFRNKTWTILFSLLALAALTVLALSLDGVTFKGAQRIGREEAASGSLDAEPFVKALGEVSTRSQVIVWVTAFFVVLLVSLLLTPEGRKALLRMFLRAAAFYWMLYYIMKNFGGQFADLLNFRGDGEQAATGEAAQTIPPPVFVPPQPTSWLTYLASLLIVALTLFAAWRAYVIWRRNFTPAQQPLKEIAEIARASLRDLRDGVDSTDAIMNCYLRMSRAVSEKRQLTRSESMTPAEFALQLERAGLPGDAVQKLTRLFEGVRYGGRRSAPKDVNEAVAALTSILHYCGESV